MIDDTPEASSGIPDPARTAPGSARRPDTSLRAGAPKLHLAQTAIRDPGVIDDIDALLAWSRDHDSRLGFFAALYWQVATGVGEAVTRGAFKNPDLIEQLDEVFFKRYQEAIDLFRADPPGPAPTASWLASFSAAGKPDYIVVQHLLLGANAHINLDLAVAIAETVPVERMASFRADYEAVNAVFATVIRKVVGNVSRFSRVLMWVSHLAGRSEDVIIGFSLKRARDGAWDAAAELATLDPGERTAAIAARDANVAAVAGIIKNPGWVAGTIIELIRRFEKRKVDIIIRDLLITGAKP